MSIRFFFFFQAEDGIRDLTVTGVQTCALPIWNPAPAPPVLLPGVRKGGSAAGAGDREGRSRHHPVRRRLAGGGGGRTALHLPLSRRPAAAPDRDCHSIPRKPPARPRARLCTP